MLVPLGTDAPVYYWPFATIGLIVVNVAAFVAQQVVPQENWEPMLNAMGDGLHPVQWITSLFLHGDIFHLVGNMVFLWAFGLIVEGKVGPFALLGIYFAVGVAEGALQQLMFMHGEPGVSLGASAAIFGLMAISMVWAPRNELNVWYFFWVGFRVFTGIWDVKVYVFAILYLLMQTLGLLVSGMLGGLDSPSSELSHLLGALFGVFAGIGLLKSNLVDCEGWDVFSRWKQGRDLAKAWKVRGEMLDRNKEGIPKVRREAKADLSSTQRAADAQRRITRMIEQGMAAPALSAYQKARAIAGWKLDEPEHLALIKLLHAQLEFEGSIPLMRDYVTLYPEKALRVRIRMAQVLVRELNRPTAALRVLEGLPAGGLPADLEAVRRKLFGQAKAMIDEGVLELEGDR